MQRTLQSLTSYPSQSVRSLQVVGCCSNRQLYSRHSCATGSDSLRADAKVSLRRFPFTSLTAVTGIKPHGWQVLREHRHHHTLQPSCLTSIRSPWFPVGLRRREVTCDLPRRYLATGHKSKPSNPTPSAVGGSGIAEIVDDGNHLVGSSSQTRSQRFGNGGVGGGMLEAKSFTPAMFGDHRQAYGSKSVWDLMLSLSFFFLCKFKYCTDNTEKLIQLTEKLFGKRLSNFILRKTVYKQFVGGADTQSIRAASTSLRHYGVGTLLALPIEDDAGGVALAEAEALFDSNLEKLLACVDLCVALEDPWPMFQLKGTALMSGDLTKIVSSMCGPTIHPEVLEMVCAGMRGQSCDFSTLPGWETFPRERTEEWRKSLLRFKAVNEAIVTKDVVAMMDAEYTYLNPALRLLALAMMEICSQDKPRVFYTYQAYLKSTPKALEDDMAMAESRDICFGAKLVRGAYLVKERSLARSQCYEDPVHKDIDSTSACYHKCLERLLTRAGQGQGRPIKFIAASHNELTVCFALKRMRELGLSPDHPSVFFGQLFGMADHLTFTLGKAGYKVYKSLPYGTVDDTIPYLARRAQENKSILENARREKALLWEALKDRVLWRG